MIFFALALLAATATPAPSAEPNVRRAPIAFRPSKDAALIQNSGSTNFAGFEIALEPNGDALVSEPGGVRRGTVPPTAAKSFFALLGANRRLGRIAVVHCMKPVSFASTTTVAWRGQRSPDLSCGGSDAAQALNRAAGAIERQLGVEPQPRNARYPM